METVAKDSELAWSSEIRYIFNEHMTSIFGIVSLCIFNFNKNYFM
jgi:hypothetical protein